MDVSWAAGRVGWALPSVGRCGSSLNKSWSSLRLAVAVGRCGWSLSVVDENCRKTIYTQVCIISGGLYLAVYIAFFSYRGVLPSCPPRNEHPVLFFATFFSLSFLRFRMFFFCALLLLWCVCSPSFFAFLARLCTYRTLSALENS